MNPPKSAPAELREQAIALRRAGRSSREIGLILGVRSKRTLAELLAGEPPPAWTLRPNAKDEQRARARHLREQGFTYKEIAADLGVSKSSVSLWVRDLPREGRLSQEEWRKRGAEATRAYWAAQHPVSEARRAAVSTAATAEIGTLTKRELVIAGAIAYWCEGSKNKPHRRDDRVAFANSDPGLITLFLRFLDVAGVAREDLIFRIQIHESADVDAAHSFWLATTETAVEQFRKPTLKPHNPATVRYNVGDGYHGCLRVEVRRSSVLFRQIEGWARGVMSRPATQGVPQRLSSPPRGADSKRQPASNSTAGPAPGIVNAPSNKQLTLRDVTPA